MKPTNFSRRNFIAAVSTAAASLGLGIPPAFGNNRFSSQTVLRRAINIQEQSWVEINNTIYGAKPDKFGPTGGGKGYFNILSQGDYTVRNLEEFLDALSEAKAGQIIFLPSEVEIDLTTRIYIEELVLEIPGGVTLAGDRGSNGSKGAILFSDSLKTPVMIRAMGPNVLITGLRIQGPNPKRHLEHHPQPRFKYFPIPLHEIDQADPGVLKQNDGY